jgi:lipopolysaccharide assembly protein A
MSLIKWIIALLIAVALAVLFAQNSGQSVDLRVFGREFLDIPLYYVLAGALLLGILFSMLLGGVRELRLRGRMRGLQRDMRERDAEIAELRALPLQDLDGDPEVD